MTGLADACGMSEYVEFPRKDYGRPIAAPRRSASASSRRRRPSVRRHLSVITAVSAVLAVFIYSGLALQMKAGNDPALSGKASASTGGRRDSGFSQSAAQSTPVPNPTPTFSDDGGGTSVQVVPVNPTPAPAPAPTPTPTPLVTGPS